MAILVLRQSEGNTEIRLPDVTVANTPLASFEVDNNFNNLNNQIDQTYNVANVVSNIATAAYNTTNTVYGVANVVYNIYPTTNAAITTANNAYTTANSVGFAFNSANTAYTEANTAYSLAVGAYTTANTSSSLAQAAYNSSNGKYNSSGGTISGDVRITGTLQIDSSLILSGNVNMINANNLSIVDNMIYLNESANTSNPDIGVVGAYNDGTYHHTGFFRDASDGVWKVFENYTPEPGNSIYIDTSNSSFRIASFQANNIYSGKIFTTSTNLVANLNSQFLNSQPGSYYLSANNLTGTIPASVITNSNLMTGGGYIMNQSVGTANNVQFNSVGVGTAASGTAGEIRATNNITAYYSDIRLKEIVGLIPNALDKVNCLSGVYFKQNKKAEEFGYNNYEQQIGVIAQQVQQILPEIIKPAPFDIDESGKSVSGENYLTVQYEKLVPLLIEAIKELSEKVKKLENDS